MAVCHQVDNPFYLYRDVCSGDLQNQEKSKFRDFPMARSASIKIVGMYQTDPCVLVLSPDKTMFVTDYEFSWVQFGWFESICTYLEVSFSITPAVFSCPAFRNNNNFF